MKTTAYVVYHRNIIPFTPMMTHACVKGLTSHTSVDTLHRLLKYGATVVVSRNDGFDSFHEREEEPIECNKEKNLKSCNCIYEICRRKGLSCEQLQYHGNMRQLPGRCFPEDVEEMFDRSSEKFARFVPDDRT